MDDEESKKRLKEIWIEMLGLDKPKPNLWKGILAGVFGPDVPKSKSWSNLSEIISILNKLYERPRLTYTSIPTEACILFESARRSREPGCIDLMLTDHFAYVCRPEHLCFEYIDESPSGSFFLLQTTPLEPSGVYSDLSSNHEELVRMPDGRYVDSTCSDEGFVDYYGDCEEPVPDDATFVIRIFRGNYLISSVDFVMPKPLADSPNWWVNLNAAAIRFALTNAGPRPS